MGKWLSSAYESNEMKKILLILFFFSLPSMLSAIDNGPAFNDSVLQARYENIISELRCLVYQNQSIKSSNVFLAVDLRNEIKRLLSDGKSDKQIAEFLVDRYGEFVLYRPRFVGANIILWLAPLIFLLIGLILIFNIVKSRANHSNDSLSGLD